MGLASIFLQSIAPRLKRISRTGDSTASVEHEKVWMGFVILWRVERVHRRVEIADSLKEMTLRPEKKN